MTFFYFSCKLWAGKTGRIMIKCHLSRLMGERKLKIADLAREIGVHRNTISLLYYEKAQRIDFEVLDKLCKYFDSTVGDLLEYKK